MPALWGRKRAVPGSAVTLTTKMKPIALLMIEHRLIERMIRLVHSEAVRAESGLKVDSSFIDKAIDFLRTYADRTHHGKEEDILFRSLAAKGIAKEHQRVLDELVAEHKIARKEVGALKEANERTKAKDPLMISEITKHLKAIAALYPAHIAKEDKHFFIPVMDYFTEEEQDAMLKEFHEFDERMIHEKYGTAVKLLEETLLNQKTQ